MVMSDYRPEVEIWPFQAHAMEIMQYDAYLHPNCGNFHML